MRSSEQKEILPYASEQKGIVQSIRENWLILAFIISVIATWTNFINADEKANERLTNLEATSAADKQTQVQVLTQLSQIQTDIQWIKTRLK